jgi:putative FmdB family regulatory protein
MPTYDYRCNACGHVLEEFQSIKAEPLKDCPKCHQPRLVRLMAGGAGMIFKGSGFYLTDYAKSNSTKANGGSPSAPKSDSTPTKSPTDSPTPSS